MNQKPEPPLQAAVHTVTRHQAGEDRGALTTQQSSLQLAQTFILHISIEFGKQGIMTK